MEREPHRRLSGIGPLDAVTPVRRDEHVIPRAQDARRRLVLEPEPGAPAEHGHPLVTFLVVPLARRRRVSGRDDPLEPERRRLHQRIEPFLGQRGGQAGEEVVHGHGS